ncbi:MAG TPA: glycosyltransferase family 4 protein [Chthonomonadaceae bacterium]|nr:glycosyltransferase family 4 protein [Chthonomonadaceae bacterium]
MNSPHSNPRVLLLIPSVVREDNVDGTDDSGPQRDYFALQSALHADILDYSALEAASMPALARLACRAGRDVALAAMGYSQRHNYDIIFSNGENVGIPLALLLKRDRSRPAHALIGHRLSARKKRLFLRALHPQMDALFLYAAPQWNYARQELGIPEAKLHRIPFHADHRFFRPLPPVPEAPERLICSAGLEWRDYPTLVEAVRGLDVKVRIGAASPWSRCRNEMQNRPLPPNVTAQRYPYGALRRLYADARAVVVPLYETDFQAGITTILEGMAMGKPVIATRTTGQGDTVCDGVNGLTVPPGDAPALRQAILRMLANPEEAACLGAQARRELVENYTLDHWVERIVSVMHTLPDPRARCTASAATAERKK